MNIRFFFFPNLNFRTKYDWLSPHFWLSASDWFDRFVRLLRLAAAISWLLLVLMPLSPLLFLLWVLLGFMNLELLSWRTCEWGTDNSSGNVIVVVYRWWCCYFCWWCCCSRQWRCIDDWSKMKSNRCMTHIYTYRFCSNVGKKEKTTEFVKHHRNIKNRTHIMNEWMTYTHTVCRRITYNMKKKKNIHRLFDKGGS